MISRLEMKRANLDERNLFVAAHPAIVYYKEIQWHGKMSPGDRMEHYPDHVEN